MVRNYLSAAEPARPGDRIAILATGIGAASNVLVRIGEAELLGRIGGTSRRQTAGVSQIVAIVPDGSQPRESRSPSASSESFPMARQSAATA